MAEELRPAQVSLDHKAYNQGTLNFLVPTESLHAMVNHKYIYADCHRDMWQRLPKLSERIGAEIKGYLKYHLGGKKYYRGDISNHGTSKRGPAIILASGPSLDKSIGRLSEWNGAIFASNSQYKALRYHGVFPDYVVPFDCRCDYDVDIKPVDKHDYDKTTMILSVTNHPNWHINWPGNVFYYRVNNEYVEFYKQMIHAAYYWIQQELKPFASSISAICSWAKFLGYGPLFLMGVDFAGYKDQQRFTDYVYNKGKWVTRLSSPMQTYEDKNITFVSKITGEKMYTEPIHCFFRRSLMSLYWLDTPNMFNCSDGLLAGCMTYVDPDYVIDTQGGGEKIQQNMKNMHQIREYISPWLAMQGVYWLPTGVEDSGRLKYKLCSCDPQEWRMQIPVMLKRMTEAGFRINEQEVMRYVESLHSEENVAYWNQFD